MVLLTIFIVMVAGYAAFHALLFSGMNPLNAPGLMVGALKGAWKAMIHFMLGLSVATVAILLFKVVIWGLALISIDILTPPYAIDIESLFALPLGSYLHNAMELSLAWAIGIAYGIVFGIAAIYLMIWWFWLRKLPI